MNGGLMVGRTNNTELLLDTSSPHAIIGPRSDRFLIQNMRFYNYNWNEAAALGSCSDCYHEKSTDSGARTINTRNLTFDSSVSKKIRYGYPFKAIFRDHDGTLTGKGANSYASFYQYHLMQPECEHLEDMYNGVTCNNSVQIKRVAFYGSQPNTESLNGGQLKIIKWDDQIIGNMTDSALTQYENNQEEYGMAPWKS